VTPKFFFSDPLDQKLIALRAEQRPKPMRSRQYRPVRPSVQILAVLAVSSSMPFL
jgi:hypothetical protein